MGDNAARHKILVIHGPNLNMLGMREPDIYGNQTLEEIDAALQAQAERLKLHIKT
ncbi:MAG: type II 3-dehydroquinate dehydratase, partial [Desulfobacterales bacterium]